ncbi:MAG: hypothetical protein ACKV2V_24465, partial [Blastocatellia bacterium]
MAEKKPRKNPADKPAAREWITVTLRASTGGVWKIRSSPQLQSLAIQLSYVASNRRRWAATDKARRELYETSEKHLIGLGISRDQVREMAEAEIVEVSIPWKDERIGWEARILPWEFLLSSATKIYRQGRKMLVTRHLDQGGKFTRTDATSHTPLLVESAPPPLDREYTFGYERKLVQAHLGLERLDAVQNPTRQQLRELALSQKPQIIHIAGIDAHQGWRLLQQEDPTLLANTEKVRDGLFLTSDEGAPEIVRAEELAQTLCPDPLSVPALVVCNFFNSAARTAALIVAHGAGAAIGFQDDIDAALAENFFATFYSLWRENGGDVLRSIQDTWAILATSGSKMRGTGVVLWSGASLLRTARPARRARKTTEKPLEKTAPTISILQTARNQPVSGPDALASLQTEIDVNPT